MSEAAEGLCIADQDCATAAMVAAYRLPKLPESTICSFLYTAAVVLLQLLDADRQP